VLESVATPSTLEEFARPPVGQQDRV
jgi:hypothetical protein